MPANNPASGARLKDLESALVDRLPQLLDEVGRLLSADWPDYAQFLAEESDEVVSAAETAVRRLVTIAEQGLSQLPQDALPESAAQVALFEEIGRVQWREGRELTTLLSAYQVGARVAWHHVSATALEHGVPPHVLAALAEAVFLFVDQLSSSSARGYVMEQQESATTRERLRDELVELLLSDRSDTAGGPRGRGAGRLAVRRERAWSSSSTRTTRSAGRCCPGWTAPACRYAGAAARRDHPRPGPGRVGGSG